MNKILVTTDFSINSKAGIRFALQVASQTPCELIFYTIKEIMKPTSWNDSTFNKYASSEIEAGQKKLMQFVTTIYKQTSMPMGQYKCVVEIGTDVDKLIIAYAKKVKVDFICMSTRGAGTIMKLFGTNASKLITTSSIPVIVVPHTYRKKPITDILYASDFENINSEIKKVENFANALNAKITVYHYDYMLDIEENKNKLNKKAAKYQSDKVSFNFKNLDIEYSLAHHLKKDIKKTKPSILVLFTNQNRNWFDRIFLSSEAADFSFDTKTPLLVFRKHETN